MSFFFFTFREISKDQASSSRIHGAEYFFHQKVLELFQNYGKVSIWLTEALLFQLNVHSNIKRKINLRIWLKVRNTQVKAKYVTEISNFLP